MRLSCGHWSAWARWVGRLREAALVGAILLAGMVGYILGSPTDRVGGVRSAQEPDPPTSTPADARTSTPGVYPNPIYTAEDAIARSLARFPPGHSPHSEIARLVSNYTLEVWLRRYPGQPTPAKEEGNWGDTNPDGPVWFVGILGEGLTDAEILSVPFDLGPGISAPGAYYGWDATTGDLVVEGAFLDSGSQSYADLAALADEPLPIEPATPAPKRRPSPADDGSTGP